MKIQMTIQMTVKECEVALDEKNQPKKTRDGSQIYQLLVCQTIQTKVGVKMVDTSDFFTINSEVEIKPSDKIISAEVEQYVIVKNNKASLYYRIKKVILTK